MRASAQHEPERGTSSKATHREAGAYPGADSVVWKVNAEIVVLLGWGRAILMQLAHPLVAAGVAEHSAFMLEPGRRIRRLRETIAAMLALTFGTEDQVAWAAGGINAIHDRVHGRLARAAGPLPAGAPYSAHDPALLRWVHATLLDSLPLAYERFVGPLTPDERDRYCAESTAIAPLLGIPDGYLPGSRLQLERYVAEMLESGSIVVSETARSLAREALFGRSPLAARPLLSFMRLPAIGLLPPALKEAYGFAWDERRERALRLSAAAIRAVVSRAPALLRHWPAARAAYARG